jgi:hypothetical protein
MAGGERERCATASTAPAASPRNQRSCSSQARRRPPRLAAAQVARDGCALRYVPALWCASWLARAALAMKRTRPEDDESEGGPAAAAASPKAAGADAPAAALALTTPPAGPMTLCYFQVCMWPLTLCFCAPCAAKTAGCCTAAHPPPPDSCSRRAPLRPWPSHTRACHGEGASPPTGSKRSRPPRGCTSRLSRCRGSARSGTSSRSSTSLPASARSSTAPPRALTLVVILSVSTNMNLAGAGSCGSRGSGLPSTTFGPAELGPAAPRNTHTGYTTRAAAHAPLSCCRSRARRELANSMQLISQSEDVYQKLTRMQDTLYAKDKVPRAELVALWQGSDPTSHNRTFGFTGARALCWPRLCLGSAWA